MRVIPTALTEVLIIEPKTFDDARGYFFECYQAQRYHAMGIEVTFVQDNVSHSQKNTLRGLHYQLEHPQAKLVWVTRGAVLDVAVDIREGSPTFGESVSVLLDDTNHRQLYIPPGFAHGFCVLSDTADFYYKCSDYYYPADEKGIIWNDTDLNISWPIAQPTLSPKDQVYPRLKNVPTKDLAKYAQ